MLVSVALVWLRQKDGSKFEACLRENARPCFKKRKTREENVIIDNRQSISFL